MSENLVDSAPEHIDIEFRQGSEMIIGHFCPWKIRVSRDDEHEHMLIEFFYRDFGESLVLRPILSGISTASVGEMSGRLSVLCITVGDSVSKAAVRIAAAFAVLREEEDRLGPKEHYEALERSLLLPDLADQTFKRCTTHWLHRV